MLRELRTDIARYTSAEAGWRNIISNPAVWVLIWYRFGHWIYKENCPRFLRWPLKLIHKVGYIFCETVMEMCLDPSASIGEGLLISHIGGIRLHPDVIIGKNCDLAQHVTIGTAGMGRKGVPILGDNVYVGTGATIIGKIRIGDGAKIAANTLVNRDVPAGATVMGVPGQIVKLAPVPKQTKS